MRFGHAGDIGDLVYHLTAVRALGGGDLVLHPSSCTAHRMTPERFRNLFPLLARQSYLHSVRWEPGYPARALNLNAWRHHYDPRKNLSDMLHQWLHLPVWPRETPWLDNVEPDPVAAVVMARSPRYRNPAFPWRRCYETYAKDAVFVGRPEEYAAFVEAHGDRVPYHPTADLYALARVIAGCKLFVGNQSSPRALAEGLKVPVVVEVDPRYNNTHFARPAAVYGYAADVALPELAAP
jgi:ADP-heptose:LPS heptosyltransferase